MKTNAAVLWEVDGDWQIEEVDLDGPKEGEVLIKFEATGLCHSDHHVRTGDSSGCRCRSSAATRVPGSSWKSDRAFGISTSETTW